MNRKEIFNKLWHAADIMRRDDGTNGINEYIEQISWMFFLKVFEDLEKRFESSAQLEGKKYSRIISKEYSWSKWTTIDTKKIIDYIDIELFPYLGKLSGTLEKNTIGIIFQEVKRNKMKSPSNLKDVLDIIKTIDFNNEEDSHVMSIFYEELLIKLGKESGIAGEFYTPRPIVKLMIKIIDPKLNKRTKDDTRILDPFCGSCGFLVESFRHIIEEGSINTKSLSLLQSSVFHGYEKKSLPFLVGLMNCILHELITPNIVRKNSLNDHILKFGPEEKFDYVLTNPPFGGTENKQIQQNFPVKVAATELLALQQVMKRLKPNGKCGMVVPDGLLASTDSESFVNVKKELLENYRLHTIISLPSGVFANVTASGQGPKASVIFFEKNGITEDIWYYEVQPSKGKKFTKKNSIVNDDLVDCYNMYKTKKQNHNSWIVKKQDIIDNNYDLSAWNPNKKTEYDVIDPFILMDEYLELSLDIQKNIKSVKKTLSDLL